ncbi:MAG: hypothetical protein WB760_22290, partial [Xanthobacteraceae bacterium]
VTSLHLPDDYALDGWGRRIMYTVDNRFTAAGALASYPNALTMTGATTSASTSVAGLVSTVGLAVNMFVYGSGLQRGINATQIAGIASATAITLSASAKATFTSDSLTFSTTPIPATAILATDATQRMTVNDQSGNAKTTQAAYVLVSFGPNGHGAWPRNGAAIGSRISSGSNHPDELTNCNCSNAAVTNAAIPAGTFVQEQPNQYAGHLGDPSYYFDDIVAFGTRSDLAAPGE